MILLTTQQPCPTIPLILLSFPTLSFCRAHRNAIQWEERHFHRTQAKIALCPHCPDRNGKFWLLLRYYSQMCIRFSRLKEILEKLQYLQNDVVSGYNLGYSLFVMFCLHYIINHLSSKRKTKQQKASSEDHIVITSDLYFNTCIIIVVINMHFKVQIRFWYFK